MKITEHSAATTSSRNVLSALRRGSAEAFSINVIGFGLVFLMHAILGRLIGLEQYGVFSHALSIATLLSIVVPLGWPTALMRLVPQYTAQGKPGLLRGSITRGHQVALVSCGLVFLVFWGLGRSGRFPPQIAQSLVFAGFLLPPLTVFVLHHKLFRGLQRIKASLIPKSLMIPLFVIGGAIVLTASTAGQVVGIYVVAGGLSCLGSAWWLLRSLKQEGFVGGPQYRTRLWMGIAIPMAFVGLSRQIINRTDMVMLGMMVNMDAVGAYGAATRVAGLSLFAATAINAIAAPLFSSAYHSGKIREFSLVLRKSIVWSTMAAVPLLAIMLLWPEVILRCFGKDFAAGSGLLQVLALGQFVNAATGPVGVALLMSERERLVALSNGVAAFLNILLNYLLITRMGAMGAAIATSSCLAALNLWKLYLCKVKILDQHL